MLNKFTNPLLKALPPSDVNTDYGSVLFALMEALGQTFNRVCDSSEGLIPEANPRTMGQMLPVRYEEAGLPDPCRGEPKTIQEKIAEVVAKWNMRGGNTLSYIQTMCNLYGYDVHISEGAVHSNTFTVDYLDITQTHFKAGLSVAGDYLDTSSMTAANCLINRIKPAHLVANYVGHTTKFW